MQLTDCGPLPPGPTASRLPRAPWPRRVCAAAFGFVLVFVLASSAQAAPPTFEWDVPGQLQAVQVGNTLWVRGRPMTLYAVRSSWKAPELRKALLERFRKARFFLPAQKPLPGVPLVHVTAVDPRTETAYTALLQPEADGTTTLYLGGVPGRAPPVVATSDIAPIFPGAKNVLESNFEGIRALSYVAKASAAEVESFYRATLTKAGFQEAEEPGTYRRSDTVLRVRPGEPRQGQLPIVILSKTEAVGE